jgi:hypothetical protein
MYFIAVGGSEAKCLRVHMITLLISLRYVIAHLPEMVSIQIFVARCPETQPSPFLRHLHSLHWMRKHALEGITQSLSVVGGQDGVNRLVIECGRLDWLARAE